MAHESLKPDPIAGLGRAGEVLQATLFEVKRVIAGQDQMLERVLMCLLARGHLLIEGVPGLAKTLTVKTVAGVLGCTFQRVQFTPDLVPADLIGTRIFSPATARFSTELGPVFCNFLLADEINRAPAKVQSALLEVMQERQVTIGLKTYEVPDPFLVMATQNPIESEGTYPLPEAQLDRFMLKVVVGYPGLAEELTVVQRSLELPPRIREVLTMDALRDLQQATGEVYVDPAVSAYAVTLVAATRRPSEFGLVELEPYIEYGASPRGAISLVHAARALAVLRRRGYALPRDVRDVAKDALRHRLVLSYAALAEEVNADQLLISVLDAIPTPSLELAEEAAA